MSVQLKVRATATIHMQDETVIEFMTETVDDAKTIADRLGYGWGAEIPVTTCIIDLMGRQHVHHS